MNVFTLVVLTIVGVALLLYWLGAWLLAYSIMSAANKRLSKKTLWRSSPPRVVLYEFQDYSHKPEVNTHTWHTIGDARDVEDYITFGQMSSECSPILSWVGLDGGPTYVGVYRKRQCSRFRRLLRERQAEITVLKERPPLGATKHLYFHPFGTL